ncbi:MAG: ATP synthase F1 subunit delta, F-type H+-transporting ATPase subunit delta [Chloroflexi bacterium CSP1-4]|nr:MAG: ATP synthase F1 subunit delta, F-type H+-transporting ATPase subunit delta [Chloroflexi bacterium CSP1-4]
MARSSSSARRYADAAFAIALRDGTVEPWRRESAAAAATLGEERLARVLANPAVPLASRAELVGVAVGASISRPVLNLVLLLLRRGRIDLLPRVAREFARLDDLRNGVVNATATSAAPLDPDEVRALTARLQRLTGGRVELTTNVDPSLLGGVVVRLGDRLIDGSVRGRLERLRSRLASGAL